MRVTALAAALLGACALVLTSPRAAPAAEDSAALAAVSVYPLRLVLDRRARSGELMLANRGTAAATYRIRFADTVMDAAGGIAEVDSLPPGQVSAKPWLRYSPRQIRLEPGQAQSIRILAQPPADLPDGEYRANIVFQALPTADAAATNVEASTARQGSIVSVSAKMAPSVSLPVIIRHGEPAATGKLLRLDPVQDGSRPALDVTIGRSGNASLYGDLRVLWQRGNGAPVQVGLARGVAVYTPNPSRRFRLYLTPPDGAAFRGGELEVSYLANPTGATVATSTIALH